MCTEQEVRVQFLLAIFFVAALSYQDVEALSIKTGICNVTITTPGLFACEKVSFENPFNGGQDVKVFVSKSHATKNYSGGDGAAIWVESVDNKEFTVCVLEYGDGSSGTTKVNWMALQSVPVGAQLDTVSLDSWSTGEKCKRIAFEKRFSIPPSIYVTVRHQILKRPQDALALWVEDVRRDSFKVCLRETKIFDGLHKNIKVDWIAFVKLMTLNSTLIHGLLTTKNNWQLNKQQNNALCQIIKFTDAFYAPPVVMVSPRLSYHNNNSRLSASATCNAVTAWIQHTFTNETEVCMRRYSNNATYKDIVQLDYLVIGDLDPCIDVTCYYHSFCKAFGPHDARCVCVDSCPPYKEPVCSSNGTTYDNRCLFEREVCLHRLNFTVQHPGSCEGFPFQRGRRHMPHIPSLGYSHCHAIHFKPFVFYPDKPIQVQITVNHMDTSDKSYVHDAAVSWVENVNNDGFTACVMAAGYNERKSYANVTVDWMAYQGAPVGGVTGEVRVSQWWTGTTCAPVMFPTGKFSVIPSVFVTAKHYNAGLKRDAASLWIEDVTQSSCKVCLRELQNYAGSHQDVVVNWLAFSYLDEPPFSEHNSIYFSNDKPPAQSHYNAFCKDATFTKVYNSTPHVFVSANHSTKNGSQNPIHNSIAEWVEYINKTCFRACVKELYEAKYDPLSVTYTVLSDICPSGWDYFNGYCYLTSSVCAPWVTAVSNCSTMNSHLVTVHNQEENVYIQHRHNGERSWIGLNDRSVEGSFVWTNKEITSFRFWAPQQPNNWKNEDCVHTLGANDGYTWNDVSCDNCYNYTCVQDIDECTSKTHNCDRNALCKNTEGSFTCTCNRGYKGDGKNCKEIDECTTNYHRCDVNAACQNTVGSYKCTCKGGYSGNGRKCVDIDECTSKTHNCDRNALCKNNEGSFTCTCNRGYKGDGKNCKEIDECTTNYHRCDVNAACQNTVGSYRCTCKGGYSGNGRKCVDIDECTSKTHNCDRNALCRNNEGSFTCTCNRGYKGDGKNCKDIDECTSNTHNCDRNLLCKNTKGSFICTCKPGYKRDSKKCKPTRGLFSYDPAQSCKEVKDLGTSNGDGEYWIDPGRTKRPFKAYCDMTTDGGGWLLVSNVVSAGSSTTQLPVKTSYRGVSSKEMVLTKSAMKELRKHLNFTQIRFHCKKRGGRTFHIITAANSTGETAVKYLSGETDVIPASCGSFVIMSNDNSRLSRACKEWGYEKGSKKIGKWGHERDQDRLYSHPAFVWAAYHWLLEPSGRWECDDYGVGVSRGDFWKVFVR